MRRLFCCTVIWALVLGLSPTLANAEYRAFLLEVRNENKELLRTIPSTLDPEQYLTYHHLPQTEFLSYTETWMCPGKTSDFKQICPNPKRQPASEPQGEGAPAGGTTDPSPQR